MNKNMICLSFSVIMLLLAGCSSVSVAPVTPANSDLGPPASATRSGTTASLPATNAPTATTLPSPTFTLILPLAMGTSLPQLSNIISSDKANDIVEIASWGGQTIPVWSVAFAPDGRILAAAGSENVVKVWDMSSAGQATTLSGHAGKVTSVAFSPDGKTLVSGSEDNTIKLWDVAGGQELRTFRAHTGDLHNYGVLYLAFSPDGRMLASVSEAFSSSTSNFFYYLDLWDVTSGKQVRTWSKYWIWGVAFSPDGKMLAWGTSNVYWKDNNVIVSDVASGRAVHTLSGHTGRVNTVAFSPDGKTLASGSDDGTMRMWDVASGGKLLTMSNTVNSPGEDEYTAAVTSVAFSPDGKTLVSGSEPGGFGVNSYTIKLWEVASGQKIGAVSGYSGAVSSVAFSPDGKLIVSNSGDGTIRLWGVSP